MWEPRFGFRLGHRRSARLRTLLGTVALAWAGAAGAIVIGFDDLPVGTAVTDQYADFGLVVDGGIIAGPFGGNAPDPVVSPPYALNDLLGPGLRLTFVGDLPTRVDMRVTTFFGDRAFLSAFGTAGALVDSDVTEGWGGTEENSTPAIPRELAELSDPRGIALVTIGALFARRGDLYIDDLNFSSTSVLPEPSVGLLAALASVAAFITRPRGRSVRLWRRHAAQEEVGLRSKYSEELRIDALVLCHYSDMI